jgi:hypothetical protein
VKPAVASSSSWLPAAEYLSSPAAWSPPEAFGAVSPSGRDQLIPGAQPALIESSCCGGMAGSWVQAAHYDVSIMQMAELSLLPTVRQQPDAIVVADGTNCRHQIATVHCRKPFM